MNLYNSKNALTGIRCDRCGEKFPVEQLYGKFNDVHSGFVVVDTVSLEYYQMCRRCLLTPSGEKK
jgi:hypothetical protein